jgi:hypothetical protein
MPEFIADRFDGKPAQTVNITYAKLPLPMIIDLVRAGDQGAIDHLKKRGKALTADSVGHEFHGNQYTGGIGGGGEGEGPRAAQGERIAAQGGMHEQIENLRAPDGGFTIDPVTGGSPPGTGSGSGNGPYAVAQPGLTYKDPATGEIPTAKDFFAADADHPGEIRGTAMVADFIRQNADVIDQPGMHIGAWNDPETGRIHIDPSEVFPAGQGQAATAAGRAQNQISIMDLSTFQTISTGGTGG